MREIKRVDGNRFFTDSSNISARGQQMKAVGAKFKNEMK